MDGPGMEGDLVTIRHKHVQQARQQDGMDVDDLVFMQNGQQVGYFEEAEAEMLVQEFRERVWKVRAGDPRKARDVIVLTRNQVARGLQSRLPAIRQVSRMLESAMVDLWDGLSGLVNVHTNQNGKWATRFWKKVRMQARRVSRTAKHNKEILANREMDAEEDAGNDDACQEPGGHGAEAATSSSQQRPVRKQDEEEMDVVSTMQRGLPPWRSKPEPRDKWLKDDRRRRRTHARNFRRPSRSKTPDRRKKGTSKGKSSTRASEAGTCARPAKAKARPSANAGARSSTDVVEVEDGTREREDFTVARRFHSGTCDKAVERADGIGSAQ